jgi:hypothetical protein
MVATKTLYTLAGAIQNFMHIAGLMRKTPYTLSQPVQKLYIH